MSCTVVERERAGRSTKEPARPDPRKPESDKDSRAPRLRRVPRRHTQRAPRGSDTRFLFSALLTVACSRAMGRRPLAPEQQPWLLQMRMPPVDAEYAHEVLRPELGAPYTAEAIRQVLFMLRTWFHLPAPVVEVLKRDARRQTLHVLAYLKVLLHRRYEELSMVSARRRRPNVDSSRKGGFAGS